MKWAIIKSNRIIFHQKKPSYQPCWEDLLRVTKMTNIYIEGYLQKVEIEEKFFSIKFIEKGETEEKIRIHFQNYQIVEIIK